MSLCLAASGKSVMLAFGAFTLAWTHSVEKIEWQEDWRLGDAGLELVEARIKGSGAGMEPPDHARFDGAWWRYTTGAAPIPQLVLARSGATGSPWRICHEGDCRAVDYYVGAGRDPVVISACPR